MLIPRAGGSCALLLDPCTQHCIINCEPIKARYNVARSHLQSVCSVNRKEDYLSGIEMSRVNDSTNDLAWPDSSPDLRNRKEIDVRDRKERSLSLSLCRIPGKFSPIPKI